MAVASRPGAAAHQIGRRGPIVAQKPAPQMPTKDPACSPIRHGARVEHHGAVDESKVALGPGGQSMPSIGMAGCGSFPCRAT